MVLLMIVIPSENKFPRERKSGISDNENYRTQGMVVFYVEYVFVI